ncbi:MAG: hypothetical protein JW840_00280 [Candidatus Thermoplasmatota archaeon]|nr:hypothetical protein [Candidatus Thermoplasmatota archaeon]
MNAKIAAWCLLILLGCSLLFLIHIDTKQSRDTIPEHLPKDPRHPSEYSACVVVDQADLQLDHEVAQYALLFHENDTINVTACMILQHLELDLEPQAILLALTNGTTAIFEEYPVSFLFYVPSALLFDMTIGGHRIAFGGRIFFRLLSHTRCRIGVSQVLSEEVHVKKGEIWYLTIADYSRKPGEVLRVTFQSVHMTSSMELLQTERHSTLGFYSALDNDFDGRYIGVKLPFLPFGFSMTNNLHTEVTTTRGSLLYFSSVGHTKGRLKVEAPGSTVYVNTKKRLALFSYYGNQTGTWNFSASGIGFPWKHMVVLFFVDADPHLTR